MKRYIVSLAALAAVGCGSGTVDGFNIPPKIEALSLGKQGSILLRRGRQQVLFPELNFSASGALESVALEIEARGPALLIAPTAQDGVDTNLSTDGKKLTLNFNGLDASQIQSFLRNQLKATPPPALSLSPTDRPIFLFSAAVNGGPLTLIAESPFFLNAGEQALSLTVFPSGRVVDADSLQEVSASGSLPAAVSAVENISTGRLGIGSLIRLESGVHQLGNAGVVIDDTDGDTNGFVNVDTDYLRIWGANFDRAGDPAVASLELKGKPRRAESTLRRSWPADGSNASLIVNQRSASSLDLRGLTIEIEAPTASQGTRAGVSTFGQSSIEGNLFTSIGAEPIDRVNAIFCANTQSVIANNRIDRCGLGALTTLGHFRFNALRQVNVALLSSDGSVSDPLRCSDNAIELNSGANRVVLAIIATGSSGSGAVIFENNDLVGFDSLNNIFAFGTIGALPTAPFISQRDNFLSSPAAGIPSGSTQTITGGLDAFSPNFLSSASIGRPSPNFPEFVP